VDPVDSGQGPLVGCCEYGDEPSGSGATELVMRSIVCSNLLYYVLVCNKSWSYVGSSVFITTLTTYYLCG
jgi:hypothetical protein